MQGRLWFGACGLLALAAPVASADRMRGFEDLAARSEQLDLTGLSGWQKGSFRLGDAGIEGRYRIVSQQAGAFGGSMHFGGSSFSLAGPALAGSYTGQCNVEKVSIADWARIGRLELTASITVSPVSYRCRFERDGQAIGLLDLVEVPARGISIKEERAGTAMLGGRQLDVRSVHNIGRSSLPAAMPIGYMIEEKGAPVAAIDLNGSRKRLLLPNDADLREATMLANIALALFWDPADD